MSVCLLFLTTFTHIVLGGVTLAQLMIFFYKIEITPYFKIIIIHAINLNEVLNVDHANVVFVNVILVIFYKVCIWHGIYLPACNAPGDTLVSSQLTLTYHLRISSYMMWHSSSVSVLTYERPRFGPRTRHREIIPANNCTMQGQNNWGNWGSPGVMKLWVAWEVLVD